MKSQGLFRNVPSVAELLDNPQVKVLLERVNRNAVVNSVRTFLDDLRSEAQRARADLRIPSVSELAERIASRILGGDAAVPQKSLLVSIDFEKSRVHNSRPVAVSHAFSTPVTPSVKRRLPMTSGVEFGPLAISTAYWFFLKAAWYFCSQTTLPSARLIAATISSGSRRPWTKTRPPATTGDE